MRSGGQPTMTHLVIAEFAQIPEIVYQIFQELPARGLHTCAQVSRLWYHWASVILRRRVECNTLFVEERTIERGDAKECCGKLYSKPSIMLLFTYEDIWLTRSRDKPRRRNVERQLLKSVRHLYDELPEQCQLLGCTTEKLIYHLPENFSMGPVHKKKGHVAISFPEVNGVTYHTVHVRHLRHHTRDWSKLFRLPTSLHVKLAIVLALPHSRDMIAYIAAGIRETYGKVTILGGVGHDRLFMDGTVRRTRAIVLLISGDQFCVRAGFLNQPVNDERVDFYEPARAMIQELESSNFRPSVALVFTSRFVHRGNSYFSSAHAIFRENFPAILTGGFYSYGEFCITERDDGRSTQECKEYMKYNSSVFCICGYSDRAEGYAL